MRMTVSLKIALALCLIFAVNADHSATDCLDEFGFPDDTKIMTSWIAHGYAARVSQCNAEDIQNIFDVNSPAYHLESSRECRKEAYRQCYQAAVGNGNICACDDLSYGGFSGTTGSHPFLIDPTSAGHADQCFGALNLILEDYPECTMDMLDLRQNQDLVSSFHSNTKAEGRQLSATECRSKISALVASECPRADNLNDRLCSCVEPDFVDANCHAEALNLFDELNCSDVSAHLSHHFNLDAVKDFNLDCYNRFFGSLTKLCSTAPAPASVADRGTPEYTSHRNMCGKHKLKAKEVNGQSCEDVSYFFQHDHEMFHSIEQQFMATNPVSAYGKDPIVEACCQVCCRPEESSSECDRNICPPCAQPICGTRPLYRNINVFVGTVDQVSCGELNEIGVYEPKRFEALKEKFEAGAASSTTRVGPLAEKCCQTCCSPEDTMHTCDRRVVPACDVYYGSHGHASTQNTVMSRWFTMLGFVGVITGLRYIC